MQRIIIIPRVWLFFGILVVSAIFPVRAWPFDSPQERATLKGISGVTVVIENLHQETEQAGLRRNQLQNDVELRLRKAGIPVSTSAMVFALIGVGVVKVETTSGALGYAYTIEVGIHQMVYLYRDTNITALALTWGAPTVFGVVDAGGLVTTIRGAVGDAVDIFINAYLEQNPKP
jgi:hypothetical protein